MIQSQNVTPFWKVHDQANKMVQESQGKHKEKWQKIKLNGPKIVNKYAKPQKNYSISKCYTFLERL